jgi:hypothetical protein
MKKLIIFSAIIATSLIATKGYSQVYVNARVGFRVPGPRVYVASAPRVYVAPRPVVYANVYAPSPAPVVYQDAYVGGPEVICEANFPGFAYYDYPAWNGHFRDFVYYQHYRPFFARDHRAYFYGGRFDHARFERERGFHRGRW